MTQLASDDYITIGSLSDELSSGMSILQCTVGWMGSGNHVRPRRFVQASRHHKARQPPVRSREGPGIQLLQRRHRRTAQPEGSAVCQSQQEVRRRPSTHCVLPNTQFGIHACCMYGALLGDCAARTSCAPPL
jgi:hypothetical protein